MAPSNAARPPTSRAATARTLPCARRCRSAFPAAPTLISSTSPTWRRPAPAMNGEVHVAFDEADFLAVFPLKQDGRARFVGTVKDDSGQQHDTLSWDDVGKRVIEWMDLDVDARQLVLDLSRPPSRRRSLPRRARVPARRRRPHPQPGRRPGHEHRDRRRREPGVEAGGRAAPRVPIRRSSTPTSPNGSRSLDAWSPRPIAPSPR